MLAETIGGTRKSWGWENVKTEDSFDALYLPKSLEVEAKTETDPLNGSNKKNRVYSFLVRRRLWLMH